jgi:antitoxin MazE
LAIQIPKALAVEAGITEGCSVEVTFSDAKMVISSVSKPKYTLDELVAGITDENQHHEIDWGPPVGNEVW